MAQTTIENEKLITGEDLFEMGDIGPCELIDGRIVRLSPAGFEHGYVTGQVGFALGIYERENRIGWTLCGAVGIYTRWSPDTVRGADVAFISQERLPDGPGRRFLEVAPELVVEIMSPTDRWQDVRQKIEEYFDAGVMWVWIVEPENRAVLVYHSVTEVRKFVEGEQILGEGVLEGFSVDVGALFAR